MFDKLEKHNNKKVTYVINRRLNLIKNTILSLLNLHKGKNEAVFSSNYSFSTKK